MTLPPISAIEALDALARTGSVRAAAGAVNLSQSAVSHKLKAGGSAGLCPDRARRAGGGADGAGAAVSGGGAAGA
ncbi:helix-turn-helix domain-containing protein [Paenirhodobacter sp.]|uniref:helix-turn-helix domain-containing protein n=1 Tax=Paenirhodobacter sp. TaxID=1965326 RepID=UPI003B3C76D2